jgi:hypothetical protein
LGSGQGCEEGTRWRREVRSQRWEAQRWLEVDDDLYMVANGMGRVCSALAQPFYFHPDLLNLGTDTVVWLVHLNRGMLLLHAHVFMTRLHSLPHHRQEWSLNYYNN